MQYEPTEGVETPTLYLGDVDDPRRIRLTFSDSPINEAIPDNILEAIKETMPGLEEIPQEPALLEVFSIDQHMEMAIESPEQLEEIARALNLMALEWKHCLKQCSCYDESDEEITDEEIDAEADRLTEVLTGLHIDFAMPDTPDQSSE